MNIIALDDEELALLALKVAICEALPDEVPICFDNAEDALQYAEKVPIDVAFLDIHMNGMNGAMLARKLIDIHKTTNIIFVTGYDEYLNEAFEMHASGYVKKPVRAKRILKEMSHLRHPVEDGKKVKMVQELGPYAFDYITQRVYYNGRDTLLKPKEFRLLCVFASSPGVFFSQDELFQKVWGSDANGDVRTVYSHIYKLRTKLGMIENSNYDIESKRNVGYRLVTPETDWLDDKNTSV